MTKINKYFIERHVHFIIKLLHITLDIFLRKNFRGLIYITLAKKSPPLHLFTLFLKRYDTLSV